jgi:hypothetical protein
MKTMQSTSSAKVQTGFNTPPPPLLPISLHAGIIDSLPEELDDEFVNEPMVPSHAVAYD